METNARDTSHDWFVLVNTPDNRKWHTLSYHDTKYDANRAAMQSMYGVTGVNVVVVHRDDLEFYLGDNANA
jgi:hypothetical protein